MYSWKIGDGIEHTEQNTREWAGQQKLGQWIIYFLL